ncbi:MAG: hypothetical protein LBB45_03775 [Methanobrevibacter sp.]|jgi:hypothetical protein|nr:hypothetical protein [Candidatus Methanovirga basalitermitum]
MILFKLSGENFPKPNGDGVIKLLRSGGLRNVDNYEDVVIVNKDKILYKGYLQGISNDGYWTINKVTLNPMLNCKGNLYIAFFHNLIIPGANQGSQKLTTTWKIATIEEIFNNSIDLPSFKR